MERYLAAVVQMASGGDRHANLTRATVLVREAAARGARLVVLPEVFSWRGAPTDEAAYLEPIPGPLTAAMGSVARADGIYLCLGSMLERGPSVERSYNTSCLLGPSGTIQACYRKLHLFDADLPDGTVVRESAARAAGTDVIVEQSPLGVLGLSICYDLRFPELYRRQARAGADLFLVPSAFTEATGAAHWEVLCRSRAIENQCYLLAANQGGVSPRGFADHGNSMIVDPWGTVLARATAPEEILLAEIDRARLARVRQAMPCLQHIRLAL